MWPSQDANDTGTVPDAPVAIVQAIWEALDWLSRGAVR